MLAIVGGRRIHGRGGAMILIFRYSRSSEGLTTVWKQVDWPSFVTIDISSRASCVHFCSFRCFFRYPGEMVLMPSVGVNNARRRNG